MRWLAHVRDERGHVGHDGTHGSLIAGIVLAVVLIGIVAFFAVGRLTGATGVGASPTPSDPTVAKVLKFYEEYTQNPSSNARKPYLTAELAAQFDAKTTKGDPVMCTTTLPRGVSVHLTSTSPDKGEKVVTVNEDFGTSSGMVDVTVRTSDMLITNISCPVLP